MVGASSHDLLDAIFDVEVSEDVLDDLDNTVPPESFQSPQIGPVQNYGDRGSSLSRDPSGTRTPRGRYISTASMPNSPGFSKRSRSRNGGMLAPPDLNSPLARAFSGRGGGELSPLVQDDVAATMRRMENLLETLPEVKVLRGELKETKERLERIETLLRSMARSSLG